MDEKVFFTWIVVFFKIKNNLYQFWSDKLPDKIQNQNLYKKEEGIIILIKIINEN
jgi:hypothetical protein